MADFFFAPLTTDDHSETEVLTSNDKWLAFAITVVAGFAMFIGALSLLCIQKHQLRFVMPIALSFSVGVVTHLCFMHLITHSIENFQYVVSDGEIDSHSDHDHDHDHDHRRLLAEENDESLSYGQVTALSHTYTALCMVAGVASFVLFQKLFLTKCGHLHSHHHANAVSDEYGSTELIKSETDAGIKYDDTEHAMIKATPSSYSNKTSLTAVSYEIALSLIVHHFPEGVATYVALVYQLEFGVLVALALSLHDVPAGISLAVTVYCATNSYVQPLLLCLFAALAYPLGAVVGYIIVEFGGDSQLPTAILFGLAAGLVLYVLLAQMIPITVAQVIEFNSAKMANYSVFGMFAGLAFMEVAVIILAATDFHAH